MAEANIASLKNDISAALTAFESELKLAGPNWETKPANSAEGEGAWCARQVAEHVVGSAGFFGVGLARAAGVDGPGRTGGEYATAADASAATPDAFARLITVVDKVQDSQLAMETEFGPLGKTTLGNVIGVVAYHLNDHANQLKTLRGA
jgi:hypothetical protein